MVKRYRRLVPVALIAAGIVMLIVGIGRDEVVIVVGKAATVCLECIGIG